MSQQILDAGIDATAYPTINGAQLNALVNLSTFSTGIGGVITTLDDAGGTPSIPNAFADTTLAKFIWVRVGYPTASGTFVTGYLWNPNAANPDNPSLFLNWWTITSVAIGPGAIQGYQIAANTIPASALIGGISPSQVIGLSDLFLNALISTSQPAAGGITGSFAGGLTIAANGISSPAMFKPGVINNQAAFSGTPILPAFVDTTLTAPVSNSALMAPNGPGQPAAWVAKAILRMAEPNNQAGYIPAVQNDGSIALVAPTSAFPAGVISAAVEIKGNSSIAPTTISAVGTTWTINTASTANVTAAQTYVTCAGFGTNYANLNGTWLVTAVNPNTSITVVTTSPYVSGSGTIGTVKFADFIGSSNVNIANVKYNSTGNYTVNFTTPKATTNYIVVASGLDTTSLNSIVVVKVVQKLTSGFILQVQALATSGGTFVTMTSSDNTDVSAIVL